MKNRSISQLAVPVGVVGIVLLLVVPLPAAVLDVLIAFNITASLVILLTSMYVKRPLDFSVFPSLILVFTLLRLGLNVASTRLVLRDGYAGQVIDAFGHYRRRRLAGHRPGDLHHPRRHPVRGDHQRRRPRRRGRRAVHPRRDARQADGDRRRPQLGPRSTRTPRAGGAPTSPRRPTSTARWTAGRKFVKGDAIAGIIITVINLIGGFVIGMVQMGLTAGDATARFSLLTVGDGLVTQIPALLMSVATGIVVTRASAETDLGTAAAQQLTQSRTALLIAGAGAIALGLLPGIPKPPFLLIGVLLIVAAQRIKARDERPAQDAALAAGATAAPSADSPEQLIEQMRVHALEVLLAPDLVELAAGGPDQDLFTRMRALRRKIALDLGIVVPPVRTRDSVDLPPSTYVVRIAGVEVGRGVLPGGRLLVLGDDLAGLPGEAVTEPVFGLSGKWVPAELRHAAEMAGATVVDRVSVLITHLGAIVGQNAPRLLGREDVRVLTESLKRVNPSVVEELVPGLLSLGEVQRVLQGLLAEEVGIRDLSRIYEAVALRAKVSAEPEGLVEAARLALAPAIAAQHATDGVLRVVTLDPALEQSFVEALRATDAGSQLLVEPDRLDAVLARLRSLVQQGEASGRPVVLVCAPAIRPALHRLVAMGLSVPVLSYAEVTGAGVRVETVGAVSLAHAIAA